MISGLFVRAQDLESLYARLRDSPSEAIVSALESSDVYTRELALAQIARENRSPELTRVAAEAVATMSQPEVKAQLIAVLAERGDTSVLPFVRKALTDQDLAVRVAAAETCGVLKDVKAADALFEMLAGEQGEVASEALRRIPGQAIDVRLLKILRDSESTCRVVAADLLAARRYKGLFHALLDKRLFESGDVALAKAVAGAIRIYAPDDSFPLILAFTLSLPESSAELLVGTLSATLGAAADKPACVRRIAQALATCEAARAPILTALLAASQDNESLRLLSLRLESDDLEVRKDAVRNLGKWNNEIALTPLVLFAKRERDAGAQTLAWRAVIDIVNRPDKVVDYYQPVSAIQQAVWHASRREEKLAALYALSHYHPKSWEVEWLLTKIETELPEMAADAQSVKASLVPPFSGLLGR